jgi:hypothetical protein
MAYKSFHFFMGTLGELKASPFTSVEAFDKEYTQWKHRAVFHIGVTGDGFISPPYPDYRDSGPVSEQQRYQGGTSCGKPIVRLPDVDITNVTDNNFLGCHLGMFLGLNPRGIWLPDVSWIKLVRVLPERINTINLWLRARDNVRRKQEWAPIARL